MRSATTPRLLQRVRDAPFLYQSFEYIPHHTELVKLPIHLLSPMMVMLQQKESEDSALPYTGRMLRWCPCTADQAPGSLPVRGGARSKTRLKLIRCTVSWKMEPSRINRPHHILSEGDTWQSEKELPACFPNAPTWVLQPHQFGLQPHPSAFQPPLVLAFSIKHFCPSGFDDFPYIFPHLLSALTVFSGQFLKSTISQP